MTNAPSRVYDSRLSARPGIGYPSCNTELCRLPRNTADPNGYYAELGIPPWSSDEEIRRAVRSLYRRLHPDTGARPDPDRLQRIKLIADVLLDPDAREAYNRTPPGRRLLDKVYLSELSALDLSGMSADDIEELLRPVPKPPPTRRWTYDYLTVDRRAGDAAKAQRWYTHLTRIAPLVGYRRTITVLIHDGPAFFHEDTGTMAIPRQWSPSALLAFALFTAVAERRPGIRR